jgi:hypothetical protein
MQQASGTMHRLEITAKTKSQFGFKPEPLEELVALHTKIHTLVSDFSKLRDAALAEISALLPESQPTLLGIVDLPKALPTPNNASPTPVPPPQSSQA